MLGADADIFVVEVILDGFPDGFRGLDSKAERLLGGILRIRHVEDCLTVPVPIVCQWDLIVEVDVLVYTQAL